MNSTTLASVITEPGVQDPRTYGAYRVTLSLPVDGGFAIRVSADASPHQYDELTFTTPDVDAANLIHRVIRYGAEQGASPATIRDAVDGALRAELHMAMSRRDTPSRRRVEHLNALLDQMESPADEAAIAELVASMRNGIPAREF
ncbi:hypothetical protein [Verrucosispora sp. TAA-831]|uniref:hypothetical protein n=1 Tax=Verrucosispora sp. TAA-831 TaxID=3422227 RepID=UPI003D6F6B56